MTIASEGPSAARRPLEGYRVIDAASIVAGPFAASILGEFGADVIKIERPIEGDALRRLGTDAGRDETYWWLSETRNKTSVALDLRTPEGAAGLRGLSRHADVLVENFRPGTLSRWGLGYEQLRAANPGLIQLSITGYGQTGPLSALAGIARIAEAFTGMSDLTGHPDRAPGLSGSAALADYVTGLYGALGVMLAIETRHRTGEGQLVDMALYDGVARFLDELVPVYVGTGHGRDRMGDETHRSVPHANFLSGDERWVTIACVNDRMFDRLTEAMSQPELIRDHRFATNAARLANREAINDVVQAWTKTLPAAEIVTCCGAASVPCAVVNTVADYVDAPQVAARDSIVTIDRPSGPVSVPGVVPRLLDSPGRIERLGCELGELDIDQAIDRWRSADATDA